MTTNTKNEALRVREFTQLMIKLTGKEGYEIPPTLAKKRASKPKPAKASQTSPTQTFERKHEILVVKNTLGFNFYFSWIIFLGSIVFLVWFLKSM